MLWKPPRHRPAVFLPRLMTILRARLGAVAGELELDEFVQLVEECKLFETFEAMQEQMQKAQNA